MRTDAAAKRLSLRAIAIAAALVSLLLVGYQVAAGLKDLHSQTPFTSLAASKYVWANAAVALAAGLLATFTPRPVRWLSIAGPAVFLLGVLAATAVGGGQLWGMLTALLLMGAAWEAGERLLRALGVELLAGNALFAWLIGLVPLSLYMILLGRVSLIEWWSAGVPLVAIGCVGCVRLATRLYGLRRRIAAELDASALTRTCAGLTLLTCGWAAIYTAAPELQYDALYGKAALPAIWARTGHMGSLVQHVQFEITGWFQVLATYGHVLGSESVGRYMQLLGLMLAPAAMWWWGRRHNVLGPLAAIVVVATPQLFWQASTADDDLLLALCAIALCTAIVQATRAVPGRAPRGLAFALGLAAGAGPSLKLHLTPLFAFLLLGWIVAGRRSRSLGERFAFAALGAAISALPPLVLRWLDSGNPLLPAYNNVFRSPDWLPINETANFPFWAHPGSLGPLRAVWDAVTEPTVMAEASVPGAFGLLVGAIVVALVLGWVGRRRSRGSMIVWFSLLPAIVFWWASLRYLRYVLPISFVSIGLVLMLISTPRLSRGVTSIAVVAAVLLTAASFSVSIAQFWNVPTHKPPVYAAIGKWNSASYEDAALLERPALLAFNRLSGPHARVATTAYEREWLKPERDIYNIHYELMPLMELHGGVAPTNGSQALASLHRIGIEWALVNGPDALLGEAGYLSEVLTQHGQIEFAERGWSLYRLVSRPRPIEPFAACDRAGKGVPSCWGGPREAAGTLGVSVTRSVRVCSGQTLALKVAELPGGPGSPVLIAFTGGSATDGVQPAETVPGVPQTIYATAPPGATSAGVIVSPVGGAKISTLTLGTTGPPCRHTRAPSA